nr:unnamed protein product [Callosobruchus analis]
MSFDIVVSHIFGAAGSRIEALVADKTSHRSRARGWFLPLSLRRTKATGPETEAQEEALSPATYLEDFRKLGTAGKGEIDAPRGGCVSSLPRGLPKDNALTAQPFIVLFKKNIFEMGRKRGRVIQGFVKRLSQSISFGVLEYNCSDCFDYNDGSTHLCEYAGIKEHTVVCLESKQLTTGASQKLQIPLKVKMVLQNSRYVVTDMSCKVNYEKTVIVDRMKPWCSTEAPEKP